MRRARSRSTPPTSAACLPVFVHDNYEGFEVKTFAELTDAELDRYLESNVTAVRDLVESLGGVDAAIANHLIMGPVILGRAGLDYALAIHGSDLSYTVIPDLERWGPYAQEACDGAAGILVGSGHIAARLRQAVDDPATNAKVRLGPPGCRHAPVRADPALGAARWPSRRSRPACASSTRRPAGRSWDRDPPRPRRTRSTGSPRRSGPRVIFVGKLIVSKGVDLLLAAWPLVHRAHPGRPPADRRLRRPRRRCCRGVSEGLARGRSSGRCASSPSTAAGLEDGEDERLRDALGVPRAPPGRATRMPPAPPPAASRFAGRLEHDEVAVPVSASDCARLPEHLPGGVRDGRRRGRVHRRAAGLGRALGRRRGQPGAGRRPAGRGQAPGLVRARATTRSRRSRRACATGSASTGRIAWRPAPRCARPVERLWSWESVARGVLDASAGRARRAPGPAERLSRLKLAPRRSSGGVVRDQ